MFCFCLAKVSTPFYHAFLLCLFSCTSSQRFFGGAIILLCSIVYCCFRYDCFGVVLWSLLFILQLLICWLHPIRIVFDIFYWSYCFVISGSCSCFCCMCSFKYYFSFVFFCSVVCFAFLIIHHIHATVSHTHTHVVITSSSSSSSSSS